jgi:hypothetical protein
MLRRLTRHLSTAACVAIAVACGGQSLTQDDGSGGTAGVGGTSGSGGSPGSGGVSGSSGSAGTGQGANPGAGGSARGGSANVGGTGGTGLTGAGRGGAGGAGGSGVGGFAGSVVLGGSAGVAGQGGATSDACSLPLETGPCDAAITRYGFNPATQRCQPFSYGGCEGNANNFETFEACVGVCGLANESGCPSAMPGNGTECSSPGHPCDYSGSTSCLCQPTALYECLDLVSSCNPQFDMAPPGGGAAGACSEPGCIEEVVIISYMTCTCDAAWTCLVGGQTAGLPR